MAKYGTYANPTNRDLKIGQQFTFIYSQYAGEKSGTKATITITNITEKNVMYKINDQGGTPWRVNKKEFLRQIESGHYTPI